MNIHQKLDHIRTMVHNLLIGEDGGVDLQDVLNVIDEDTDGQSSSIEMTHVEEKIYANTYATFFLKECSEQYSEPSALEIASMAYSSVEIGLMSVTAHRAGVNKATKTITEPGMKAMLAHLTRGVR